MITNWTRFALWCSGTIIAAYSIASIIVRPGMYSDSGWGFRVLEAMRRGAPFNYGMGPDRADIARDVQGFSTTWTPGQYVLPGLLETLGLDLGQAIIVTVALCSAIGLAGWHRLYITFGFAPRTAAITVTMIACTRFFTQPFGLYNGGEVLLFAAAPWFAYGVWRIGDLHLRHVPAIVVGISVLCFAKLSGAIFGGAILAGAVPVASGSWLSRTTLRRGVTVALSVTLFGLGFYYFWLSRGWTAASGSSEIDPSQLPSQLAFVINAIALSSLSVGDLASYLLLHPSRPVASSLDALNLLLAPIAMAAIGFAWLRLPPEFNRYRLFVGIAVLAYGAVLVLLFVRGSAVSLEERHFRPVSLLLLVGIVHVYSQLQSDLLRIGVTTLAVVLVLYGLTSFLNRLVSNAQKPLDWRGLRHGIADQAALDALRRVDVVLPDGSMPLVLVTSPEISLPLRNSRSMSNHADFEEAEILGARVYRGRVGRLYVLIQTRLVENGKADIILRSFRDYQRDLWKSEKVGSFTLFSQ